MTVTRRRGCSRGVGFGGLRPLRRYDLCHGSATLGLDAGEDLKAVSERLGHSTITLTANVYSHVGDGTKRKAAVAREALLFGAAAAR